VGGPGQLLFRHHLYRRGGLLSNIGPGLEAVGPMGNFALFSPLSKLALTACMVIGRLEVFPILILCSTAAWRRVNRFLSRPGRERALPAPSFFCCFSPANTKFFTKFFGTPLFCIYGLPPP
jgi:hypothetical protein